MKISRLAHAFVALLLAACATPGRVSVEPNQVYSLGLAYSPSDLKVKVIDARLPDEVGERELAAGVQLGEHRFQPTPLVAIATSLSQLLTSAKLADDSRRALLEKPVKLRRFVVTMTSTDVSVGAGGNGPPGVAAMDYMMKSLAQATLGGSNVTALIEIEVDGRLVSGLGTGRFTASPSSFATSAVYGRAFSSIQRQLE